MEIPRYVQTSIENQLGKQKVVLLYGTRRSGKTTIIENTTFGEPTTGRR